MVIDLAETSGTALAWSREANAIIRSHGAERSVLRGRRTHFGKQVALAGYRMAVLLDKIAEEYNAQSWDGGDAELEL
ncbi:hypothetical protein V2A60_010153 [Cordyceps javanica]